jgi:hypothetical protein
MKPRRSCSECGHHWAWHLDDGRFKCRNCRRVYTWCSVWDANRLSEGDKRKLLKYFVLVFRRIALGFERRVRVPQPNGFIARFVQ